MNSLKGKKLLVIGGAFQHKKVVETAKRLGVITYVVDNLPLEKSQTKQIADYHFEINVFDTDSLIDICKEEKIDGVISTHLDACQIPYLSVCEALGYPCFGTRKQFEVLTQKNLFIKFCVEHGVGVIPQYKEEDFIEFNDKIEYPLFVKPCDSRGSRGQTICYSYSEMKKAIDFAKSESSTKKIMIEKYMGDKKDFSFTYLVINGVPYLIRTGDRFLGAKEDKMDKSAIFGIAPSRNSDVYLQHSSRLIEKLIISLGIENGPVFMQGFIDEKQCYMYDPGLRFPGIDYDIALKKATGFDGVEMCIYYALTGEMPSLPDEINNCWKLNGKYAANLFVVLRPGKINKIIGLDDISTKDYVTRIAAQKYYEGDTVGEHWNVNQRLCEIDILTNTIGEMKLAIDSIYRTLFVLDENERDMKISVFDVNLLKDYII